MVGMGKRPVEFDCLCLTCSGWRDDFIRVGMSIISHAAYLRVMGQSCWSNIAGDEGKKSADLIKCRSAYRLIRNCCWIIVRVGARTLYGAPKRDRGQLLSLRDWRG